MNTLDFFHIYARYNRWMNRKIYDAAAEFPDAERKRDLGAFFKSIHGTLNHLVLTDRIWLGRFTGDTERFRSLDSSGKPIDIHSLGQVLYEDFAELRHERERTDSDIGKFVVSLSRDVLETPPSLPNEFRGALQPSLVVGPDAYVQPRHPQSWTNDNAAKATRQGSWRHRSGGNAEE